MTIDWLTTFGNLAAGALIARLVPSAYSRFTTKMVGRLYEYSFGGVYFLQEEQISGHTLHEAIASLSAEYGLYQGKFEVCNVRGKDAKDITVELGIPMHYFASEHELPGKLPTMTECRSGICRRNPCWIVSIRLTNVDLVVTQTRQVARFAVIAPRSDKPMILYWRIIADSLVHPARDFAAQQVSLRTLDEIHTELIRFDESR